MGFTFNARAKQAEIKQMRTEMDQVISDIADSLDNSGRGVSRSMIENIIGGYLASKGGASCGSGVVIGENTTSVTQCCRTEEDSQGEKYCAATEDCKQTTLTCGNRDGSGRSWPSTGQPYSCVDSKGSECQPNPGGGDDGGDALITLPE